MNCTNCGNNINEGFSFCTVCGQAVAPIETATPIEIVAPIEIVNPTPAPVVAPAPAVKAKKPKSGKGLVILSIVLAILLVAASGFGVYQVIIGNDQAVELEDKVDDLEKDIDKKDDSITSLNKEIDNIESELAEKESQIESLNSTVDNYKSKETEYLAKISKLEDSLEFYEEYVVVVGDDGTNRYHTYGCSQFGDTSFWAFNINAAEGKGYEPCPYCQ